VRYRLANRPVEDAGRWAMIVTVGDTLRYRGGQPRRAEIEEVPQTVCSHNLHVERLLSEPGWR
jgi:hypothetical protein